MKEKNITITLNEAIKWYNSGNTALKKVALQAFNKEELEYNFKKIITFKKACRAVGYDYNNMIYMAEFIATHNKASAAMFKLNIIRKALNLNWDLHLTKNPNNDYIYFPYNPFVTESSTYYKDSINSGKIKVIGKIKSGGVLYNVLGGDAIISNDGLGGFVFHTGIGTAGANAGFLGCATKEMAQHFGKYFGMLITEAKYGDLTDFEIISDYSKSC